LFRSAIVTGGAAGIGAAVVAALEREGTQVQSLDLATGFDVSDPQAWEGVGAVELACLNAGIGTAGFSLESYRRLVGVNVDGVVFGVERLSRTMEPGGSIVVTASLAGLVPLAMNPLYTLTKHAVVGYVRAMAPALERQGIRINAVCPGFADTAIVDDHARAWLREQGIPLLRPEQVADAILHAARSDDTGRCWVVQPGREPIRYEFRGVPGPR
jgi:NAD(P)-dependent dehydrogenase (short-subunit alcohol dehydrogenase family)